MDIFVVQKIYSRCAHLAKTHLQIIVIVNVTLFFLLAQGKVALDFFKPVIMLNSGRETMVSWAARDTLKTQWFVSSQQSNCMATTYEKEVTMGYMESSLRG